MLWGKRRQEPSWSGNDDQGAAQAGVELTPLASETGAGGVNGTGAAEFVPTMVEPSTARDPGSVLHVAKEPPQAPNSETASAVHTAAAAGQPAPRQLTAAEVQFAVAFTRVISVLSKSNPYRGATLGDLEWLVVPPLMTGQFAVMDAQINGQTVPVAVAFWALVSPEVDQRLSDTTVSFVRLRPEEWSSGDILWLVDVVGDPNAIPHLLQQLRPAVFKGQMAKIRRHGANSNVFVDQDRWDKAE